MASVHPAALSHFAVFCPSLGPDEDSAHEQLLFYAAASLPPFYPYSANDYFARNVHLRRRSSGGNTVSETTISASKTAAVSVGSSLSASGGEFSGGRRGGAPKSPTTRVIANAGTQSDDSSAQTTRERVVSLDMKLREIGLGAALLAFAGTFGTNSRRFHIVHSEKRRTLIFQAEPGVLIQLSVVLPRRVRPYGKEKDAYSIEFLDSQISDNALEAWMRQEYWAFRIMFGPIGRVMDGKRSSGVRQMVKRQLDLFFGRTIWFWDSRWDAKGGSELDLLHSLLPLPQLPLGSISLGGFEEFWRDLSLLSADREAESEQQSETVPLVHNMVVLWRGSEIVWSSWLLPGLAESSDNGQHEDRAHLMRALVAWSRAVYAPVFDVAVKKPASEAVTEARETMVQSPMSPPSRPASVLSVGSSRIVGGNRQPPPHASSVSHHAQGGGSGWSAFPGSSWLWGGWRGQQTVQIPEDVDGAAISSDERTSSANTSNRSSIDAQGPSNPVNSAISGGLTQALSRAVNLLVEPSPPTPPEEDPIFATTTESHQQQHEQHNHSQGLQQDHVSNVDQYVISAADIDASGTHGEMLVRDSDVESLWSVGSLASVKTTRTTATAAPILGTSRVLAQRSSVGRVRSSTIQQGNIIGSGGGTSIPSSSYFSRAPHFSRHGRMPSGVSSVGTAGSTQLRDDTRVSLRSWWPASWTWGGTQPEEQSQQQQKQQQQSTQALDSVGGRQNIDIPYSSPQSASGINMESTFLYTGEHRFPGAAGSDGGVGKAKSRGKGKGFDERSQQPASSNRAEHILVNGNDEESTEAETGNQETIDQLGLAMGDEMPAGYEHGVNVDGSRGVMLAPRAVEGMLYDTRLVKMLYDDGSDGYRGSRDAQDRQKHQHEHRSAAMVELPLFVGSRDLWQQGPLPCDRAMQAIGAPTCVEDIATRCSRTLVYKYGDMLYIVFGAPTSHYASTDIAGERKGKQAEPKADSEDINTSSRRGRRARKDRRRKAAAVTPAGSLASDEGACADDSHAEKNVCFSSNESLAIESAILRYAESLQAATQRDVGEIRAQQRNEAQLTKQRRIPPYMYHKEEVVGTARDAGNEMEDRRGGDEYNPMQRLSATLTNWQHDDATMPVNRSFQGLMENRRSKKDKETSKQPPPPPLLLLPENVRTVLTAVNAELAKHREKGDDDVSVCVRMQDKGWVAAQQNRKEQTYCVVDQPNATLADAHNFLSRISKRARSLDSSR
ncbi:hypothetical protein LPJ72_003812 [Coemansia sp. Benny D160-2]|nr:hypothetical protein LPJ72_003812 [Coemansia sp. Benny D160-2]